MTGRQLEFVLKLTKFLVWIFLNNNNELGGNFYSAVTHREG